MWRSRARWPVEAVVYVYAGCSVFCWFAVEAQNTISRGNNIVTEDRIKAEDSTMSDYHVVMSLHADNDKTRVAAPRLLLEGRLTTDSRGKGGRCGWSRPAHAGGQIGPRHFVRPWMCEDSRRPRGSRVQCHGTKSSLPRIMQDHTTWHLCARRPCDNRTLGLASRSGGESPGDEQQTQGRRHAVSACRCPIGGWPTAAAAREGSAEPSEERWTERGPDHPLKAPTREDLTWARATHPARPSLESRSPPRFASSSSGRSNRRDRSEVEATIGGAGR
jgi:hypothetical protein